MRMVRPVRQLGAIVAAAVLSIGSVFVSEAAAVMPDVPVTMHMDLNSRKTSIYDGYSSYVLGYRASEEDTFTVTKDKNDINLDDVTMNYYLITYDGETQKYLECTVTGLKEGIHYPIVRPETVEREKNAGGLYDTLDRCYVVEFRYGDARTNLYFSILPESDMNAYRNILLGKWIKESKGWKYEYQGENLTSWALVNDNWYYFGTDGYMKTGWQEYKDDWYYLNPDNGVMRVDCTIDGYQLDRSGKRV